MDNEKNFSSKRDVSDEKTENSGQNGAVIIFPDFQKVKDSVERRRTELSMLLLERDELQFVICRNIETAYYLKLGALEHKAYEAECTALRLKRKIELIQAKINRQEKVIASQIEAALDKEFSDYQAKLNEQIEKMNKALERSKGKFLSDEETKEIKKLYRNVVKKLHPDIHPNVTEAEIKLFQNAVTAYENGDIETLRIIETMVGDHIVPDEPENALSVLVEENKRLEKMIANIQNSIAEMKSRYPYSVKDIVEQPEKEAQRKEELQSVIKQYNELIEIYKARLSELTR